MPARGNRCLGRIEELESLARVAGRQVVLALLGVQSRLCPVDLGERERVTALHLADDPGQELGGLGKRRHVGQRVREQNGEAEPRGRSFSCSARASAFRKSAIDASVPPERK